MLAKSAALVRWCEDRDLLTGWVIDEVVHESLLRPNEESTEIPLAFVVIPIGVAWDPRHAPLVEFVLSKINSKVQRLVTYAATRAGGDKVLQWTTEFTDEVDARRILGLPSAIRMAKSSGHLATMEWLVQEQQVQSIKPPIDRMSDSHALDVLQWLHANGCGSWLQTIDMAASSGYLRVVQWLHEHRQDGWTTRAMDWAAANGHLHVVEWLHVNRSEGCTDGAMNSAAWAGHVDVVQWLDTNRSDGNVNAAMAIGAVNGQLEVVQWCSEHGGCTRCVRTEVVRQPLAYEIDTFRGVRFLYTLQWLAQHEHSAAVGCAGHCIPSFDSVPPVLLVRTALSTGNLLLLEYLHAHYADLFAAQEAARHVRMNAITYKGHLPALQWLYERYPTCYDWEQLAGFAEEQEERAIASWLRALPKSAK